jgi:TRAP-type C4-dicarboxylate transport system permease small subunit
MLEAATVIFFAAMTIAGIVVSPNDGEWLDRWANTISSGVLGGLVLVTLPFRPFTEAYAREQTPPEIWNTREFRRTNQVITLVWGGVFVGTAILGAIAASSPSSSDWTNWILPIALIVIGFKFTQRYPEVVRERVRARAARSSADLPEPGTPARAR